MNKIISQGNLNRAEIYFFYAFLVINLLPVLVLKFFPTVDGPAHLYNSRLIVELITQNSPLNNYFSFNEISPNWLGHIILGLFQLLFPAYIAEKCLLLIYFIGFPISFRAFIKIQPIRSNALIYFVFPFTYSFLLFYGFFNFHIALVFFYWALYLWVKYDHKFTTRRTLFLLILTTLMCLSHLFVFTVFIFSVAIMNISELKYILKPDKEIRKKSLSFLIRQVLAFSIGVVIMLKFIFDNAVNNTVPTYIRSSVLLKWLLQVQPAKGIVYGREDIFTRWIFISLILLISYLLFIEIKKIFVLRTKENFSTAFDQRINYWFIISILLLIALFVIPDSNGATFGFISSRIILFFFLFLIVWLSTSKFHAWIQILVFIIINYVNIALLNIYYSAARDNNILISEIIKVSDKIEPFNAVLPILNSDYWLYGHISNYLGIDKPMVILENYEATLDYFPIKWNWNTIPNLYFGELSTANNCLSWVSNPNNDISVIEYVFILNIEDKETLSDDCITEISTALEKDYMEVYRSKDNKMLLYRHNQNH